MLDFYRQLGSYINQGFVIFTENGLTHTVHDFALRNHEQWRYNMNIIEMSDEEDDEVEEGDDDE